MSIVDVASSGALVDKTPAAANQLISNMGANTQQFGTRNDSPKKVNELCINSIEQQLSTLTSLVG